MTTRRAPCPVCDRGPRDTAMAVTVDERGTVNYCHRCGYARADHIVTDAGRAPAPRTYRPWQGLAEYLWSQTLPLAGTIAEKYLLGRGCRLPPADGDLRFLPARGEHPAAMVGRITDSLMYDPISLHFTRLDPNGCKTGDKPKRLLSGHRKQGGVIKLWADDCVEYGLCIGEGIESCLAAAHAFQPVWSCIDASNLSQFPVLKGIDALMICADHDLAGLKAAKECARRWKAAGREVRIAMSSTEGEDAADLARAAA